MKTYPFQEGVFVLKNIGFIFFLMVLLSVFTRQVAGQDIFMDASTKELLDSLEIRISQLGRSLPQLAETRNPAYFFIKRELDVTIFISQFHQYLFEESYERADTLIDIRMKAARKRGDQVSVEFYQDYRKKYNRKRSEHQEKYQKLFYKEKNFRKEFYRLVDKGDRYSLFRAERMTDLSIRYARQKELESVIEYLKGYREIIDYTIFDLESNYELAKLTRSEDKFNKVFLPWIESDSLVLIREAKTLVDHCYNYALIKPTLLDTVFFGAQRNLVDLSIKEYIERQGNSAFLSELEGEALTARLDTLNREGVYQWNEKILVVGHFKFSAKFDIVKRGEAIIDADQRLIKYILENRLAKIRKQVKMGHTFVIPFDRKDETLDFCFNPAEKMYQYMVCYTKIESAYFTREIGKYLPLIKFSGENESR